LRVKVFLRLVGGRGDSRGSGRRVWNGVGDGEGQVALSVGSVNRFSLVSLEGFQLVGLVFELNESVATGSAVSGEGNMGSLGLGSTEYGQEFGISNGEGKVGHEQGGLGRDLFTGFTRLTGLTRRTRGTGRLLGIGSVGAAGGSVGTTFSFFAGASAVARFAAAATLFGVGVVSGVGSVVARGVVAGVSSVGGAASSIVRSTSSTSCRAVTILLASLLLFVFSSLFRDVFCELDLDFATSDISSFHFFNCISSLLSGCELNETIAEAASAASDDDSRFYFTVFAERFSESLVSGSKGQIADENFSGHWGILWTGNGAG